MNKNLFLCDEWFASHLKKIKNKAGGRYSPSLNVELPISEIFDGLSRSSRFYVSIRKHLGSFDRAFRYISSEYSSHRTKGIYNKFKEEVIGIRDMLEPIKDFDIKIIPWKEINNRCKKIDKISWQFSDKLRSDKDKSEKLISSKETVTKSTSSEKYGSDIHHLYEVQKELRFFEQLSSSAQAALSNKPFLLLTGLAGTGKTHLLCDVVEDHVRDVSKPAGIVVFGEDFNLNGSPWNQIVGQLNPKGSVKMLLSSLNNLGKQSKSRVILIIDALNETREKKYWKNNMDSILSDVKKYPHIGLVVSIRSGFEEEVLTKKQIKSFVNEEHKGFQFREWEAVQKFFKEFNLPFPEIPLLVPEFQNPLFLLLFCKAFQERAKKNTGKKGKQIFRGHEGATYIFESFVDGVSEKICKKFGITGLKKNIWDLVIEKVAEIMINNDDRVSEEALVKIVEEDYKNIDSTLFIKELERNLLIVKIPRYSQQLKAYSGFDFRFPFQKFSDHLLGRYVFKKYEAEFGKGNKNIATAKQFFSKRRKLGKYLSRSWNRGLIEALSIQCPEQLRGNELVDVAPYLKQSDAAQDAFVESLVWRNPASFSANMINTRDYINKYIIRTEQGNSNLLNAFLSVAPIPDHPFNADFLHRNLMNRTMPKRDSWWSVFLHRQYGQEGAVDRLIEWAWSDVDRSAISDESIRLCATALCWFLTSSNRFVRDKSTKALVSLLTNRLGVVISLLKEFELVNDSYVSERLYAISYGCAIRTVDQPEELKELTTLVYKSIFEKGTPPVNILLRDYARGVIEVACNRFPDLHFDKSKYLPPYKSTWPKRIPSDKLLKKRYYPEDFFKDKTTDRGFLDIWSSVMYNFGSLADFGNYVLNSEVSYWSGRKLNGGDINRKELISNFKKSLTPVQLKLYEKAMNPYYGISKSNLFKHIKIVSYDETPEEKELEKVSEEKTKKLMEDCIYEFESSIDKDKLYLFKNGIKPYVDDRGYVNDTLERFDTGLAQRWVFNRVVQLGWDSKLHGEFDKNVDYNRSDRSDHKAERIGKKYQWIALRELLGRISDNFEFKGERWSDKTFAYEGPWQVGTRDIDPTCTLKEFPNTKPNKVPTFVKYSQIAKYDAWKTGSTDISWLKSEKDLPELNNFIEITDDQNNKWLAMEGFVEWQEETLPEYEKYSVPIRTLWYMVKGYLTKRVNSKKFYGWASKQDFMGRWMPESHEFYDIHLGEYPWAPAFMSRYIPYFHHNEWTRGDRKEKLPASILVVDDEYLSSGSSKDCSTGESISVKLPAKWIVDKMKLEQSYCDGRFFDKSGKLVVYDPIVFDKNAPRFLLFRKNEFTEFLNKRGLVAEWTLLGEKNLIGGRETKKTQGRLELSGAFLLDASGNSLQVVNKKFKSFDSVS